MTPLQASAAEYQSILTARELERTAVTLPDERYRAVLAAERLLLDLCDPKTTPRVPAAIRGRARSALRHFPSKYDLSCAAALAPQVFAERMEDLHRFLLKGRQSLDGGEE
jgi:hypothetical protein